VTRVEDRTFHSCTNLTTILFEGDAPTLGGVDIFSGDNHATVYLAGTSGWGLVLPGGRLRLVTSKDVTTHQDAGRLSDHFRGSRAQR
jgi:hypothetical protein